MMGIYDGEEKIRELIGVMNSRGRNIPQTIDGFDDLPFEYFDQLISEIKRGGAKIYRFNVNMDGSIFSVVAAPHQKFLNTFGLLLAYGGILGTAVASYFVSWWLLLLIPIVFIVGSKITKNSYNEAILYAALNSELMFCFLYFAGHISLEVCSTGEHYYYKAE